MSKPLHRYMKSQRQEDGTNKGTVEKKIVQEAIEYIKDALRGCKGLGRIKDLFYVDIEGDEDQPHVGFNVVGDKHKANGFQEIGQVHERLVSALMCAEEWFDDLYSTLLQFCHAQPEFSEVEIRLYLEHNCAIASLEGRDQRKEFSMLISTEGKNERDAVETPQTKIYKKWQRVESKPTDLKIDKQGTDIDETNQETQAAGEDGHDGQVGYNRSSYLGKASNQDKNKSSHKTVKDNGWNKGAKGPNARERHRGHWWPSGFYIFR